MLPTKFQFIWQSGFQRRTLKCEQLTDNGRRTPSDGKSEIIASKRPDLSLSQNSASLQVGET
jgi:hypothetical protein